MMKSRFKAIVCIWALSLAFPAVAQNTKPNTEKTADNHSPKAEQKISEKNDDVQQLAVALVKSLLEASGSLENGSFKVGLQARIGETLWRYDERLARHAFEESLQAINSMHSEPGGRTHSPNDDFFFRSQLRRDVIEVLARVDSEWAKKVVLGSIKIPDGKTNRRPDYHSMMSLSAADPRTAIEMLRTNINVREDATLLRGVLVKIRPNHPTLADEAFDYALSLAEENLRQPFSYFFEVFDYVFPEFRHQVEGDTDYTSSVTSNPIDDSLIRRFLAFGYRAIMKEADEIAKESKSISERSAYGYDYVMGMLPAFQPYMPAEEATMRSHWNEVIGNLRGGREAIKEWNLVRHPPAVELLEREAEAAKRSDDRNGYYLLAANRALSDGQYDRAFTIISKLPDAEDRNKERTVLVTKAAIVALDKGDLEEAYRFGREIDEQYARINVMNRLLNALLDRKDSTRAARILEEALQKAAKDDLKQMQEFLSLAEIAIRLNPERGFAVTKSGVEALNRSRLDDGTPYISGNDTFDRTLLPLARVDFARALSLAQMLNSENLLLAKLAVCRGVLLKPNPSRRL